MTYRDYNSEEQQKLADEIVDQYFAAKADKESKNLHTDWGTYDDYWRSKQNEKVDEDDPGSVTNIIHPLIENQVADLTDATLQITAKAFDYGGAQYREMVQRILQWVLDWNRFTVKLERGERWRLKFGTSWVHVTFDPMENYPHGMIRLNFENPANVFPDPKVKAPHLIDDAEFVILEIVKPLPWFKRNFPERGQFVRQDFTNGEGSVIFDGEDQTQSFDVGGNQARLLIRYSMDDKGYMRCVKLGGEDSRVVLYDSNTDEKLEEKDANGKVVGRKPWLKLRRYPCRPIPCYPKEGQVWAMGDIELVKPVQDLINELDDQIRMNAKQMAWLIWFINASAGVKVSQLNTREPGVVIPVRGNPSQQVFAQQPREMPAYVTARRETAKSEAERVVSRPEVNQGFRPEGVNTFGGLALLQQQGAKKSDHKRKMLLEYLSEALEIVLSMAMQLFTEQQTATVEGKDGEQEFIPFKGSDLGAIPRFFHDGESWKQMMDEDGNTPMTQEGRWRIQVGIGQGMPKDSTFRYQALLALMQSPSSQMLFAGLAPEDIHRIRKSIFSMIGVELSDEVSQPPPTETPPPAGGQAPPAMEGMDPAIMAELEQIQQSANPAEMQEAMSSLPPQIQQALASMMGGGGNVRG
jgi:hypothetical protein